MSARSASLAAWAMGGASSASAKALAAHVNLYTMVLLGSCHDSCRPRGRHATSTQRSEGGARLEYQAGADSVRDAAALNMRAIAMAAGGKAGTPVVRADAPPASSEHSRQTVSADGACRLCSCAGCR